MLEIWKQKIEEMFFDKEKLKAQAIQAAALKEAVEAEEEKEREKLEKEFQKCLALAERSSTTIPLDIVSGSVSSYVSGHIASCITPCGITPMQSPSSPADHLKPSTQKTFYHFSHLLDPPIQFDDDEYLRIVKEIQDQINELLNSGHIPLTLILGYCDFWQLCSGNQRTKDINKIISNLDIKK
jgi:hypothetical protein